MMKYKICKIFLLLIPALNINNIAAQDNTPESRTIKVNKGVFCQIDFTTQVSYDFTLPKNSKEFYSLDKTNAGKAITIETKQESLPPTTLIVTETNGKIWNITIEYKDDIDEENESIYDFSDNTIKPAKNNIELKETDLRLNCKNQSEALPYTTPEMNRLKKLYPDIDFTNPPPEQTFNLAYTDNDVALIDHLYYSTPAVLKKAFKSDMVSIRIVCENLSFKGTNAYFKFLIQNEATEDFFTGCMRLTWLRQNGDELSLHPGSVYPNKFPIVKPNSQIALIYVFKAFDIGDDERLKFEIQDRLQKINVEFFIPGSIYNEARKD